MAKNYFVCPRCGAIHDYDPNPAVTWNARTTTSELLAALRAVVAMYGPSSDYGHESRAVWEQAEAAIAKAEC